MHCKCWNWICHWKLLLGSFSLHDRHLPSTSPQVLLIFPWQNLSNVFIIDTFFSYFIYLTIPPPQHTHINMFFLETGAYISSSTACFLLQRIYLSAPARELHLVQLRHAIFQLVVCFKFPHCALPKTVQDIKDLMLLRESSALKALCSL